MTSAQLIAECYRAAGIDPFVATDARGRVYQSDGMIVPADFAGYYLHNTAWECPEHPGILLKLVGQRLYCRRADHTEPVAITCPRCRQTSWSPDDAREGYCGSCREWTSPELSEEERL